MKEKTNKLLKQIKDGKDYNPKEVLQILIYLCQDAIDDINKDFNNIIKYKDIFHLFNNYEIFDYLYVEETMNFIKKEINYQEEITKRFKKFLTKIKEDSINKEEFESLFDYLYLISYKDINSTIYDFIFKMNIGNNIDKKVLKQAVNALTHKRLKEIGIKNATSQFVNDLDNKLAICCSNLETINNKDELNISIKYSEELIDMDNADIIVTIFHELRHAEICGKVNVINNYYFYQIIKNYCLYNIIDENDSNYEKDIEEINAITFSIVNSYKYLKFLFPNLSSKYIKNEKELFLHLQKMKDDQIRTVSNKEYHFDLLFEDLITKYYNFIIYSNKYPMIKFEYYLDNNKIIRKSTLEMLNDKHKVLNVNEYALIDSIINNRYLKFDNMIEDGYILLNNTNIDLDKDIYEYLNNVYLNKLLKQIDIKNEQQVIKCAKIKLAIDEYNEKTNHKKVRYRDDQRNRINNN